ncbi:hypothetical protein KPSA1_07180 [Pseudomonas syringae pv. actinidiae]|uniref:Uncharacterized protein n=1 Tax=Pseudomonas syringae pv. actinidiae TaxID=103796 RepID=A0A2V0QSP7_PSESF|nr:hypothetical protein KPSA1_07180 [Pseudomonas syringae pv. actinidiae]
MPHTYSERLTRRIANRLFATLYKSRNIGSNNW